nr:PqqD family peptide modification chaperone [Burkholderiales bacterium]
DEGEAVLLHLGSRKYFTLNASGLTIWRGLDEGLSISEVSQRLVADHSIPEDRALAAVMRLVAELRDADLVQVAA